MPAHSPPHTSGCYVMSTHAIGFAHAAFKRAMHPRKDRHGAPHTTEVHAARHAAEAPANDSFIAFAAPQYRTSRCHRHAAMTA